ncbi:hypothetical protein [Streptomyces sp. NRRL B-24484]|uniref:hypothetical protein n=1 Tax=Streptomyces sp. NRRL B-24484 TaxID=1463833 RepID=UPI0004BEE412|nr:hypothetical protein [Streptomyces sp. NRRL B-24484]
MQRLRHDLAQSGRTTGDDGGEIRLTPAARRLADCYQRLLELVERCGRSVEVGDWVILADEAGDLSVTADEVASAAEALTRDEVPTPPVDVLAMVERLSRPPD